MTQQIKKYENLVLLDIANEIPVLSDISMFDVIRLQISSEPATIKLLQEQGFVWVDRTIKTEIFLSRISADLEKMIRLPIEFSTEYKSEILEIAIRNFKYDRRFHITPNCNSNTAALVLREWINNLSEVLICRFKNQIIGFLALQETSPDSTFINLAAVEEKYRTTGAALGLYAKACLWARNQGYKKIEGRISSMNTPVMNLYAFLGANFSSPQDIFLKEVIHK